MASNWLRCEYEAAPKFGYQNDFEVILFDTFHFGLAWWPWFFRWCREAGITTELFYSWGPCAGFMLSVNIEPLGRFRVFVNAKSTEYDTAVDQTTHLL